MPEDSFKDLSSQDLLQLYSLLLTELNQRAVIRTYNSPVGDYAEWLVATKLGLDLVSNSTSSFDAEDKQGRKYQIKARWITGPKSSRLLSDFRHFDEGDFDYLVAILFDKLFDVQCAYRIPRHIVVRYMKRADYVSAHRLTLHGGVLLEPEVEDITSLLNEPMRK